MEYFIIHLLFCSFLLCVATVGFLLLKKIFQKTLSRLISYYLWLILVGLFCVPFLSFLPCFRLPALSWDKWLPHISFSTSSVPGQATTQTSVSTATAWMKDFAISVHHPDFALLFKILFFIWVAGVLTVTVYLVRSAFLLSTLHRMSRPLLHNETMIIFQSCLKELGIRRSISVYTVDSLYSPAMTGILRPRIYLPTDFLSEHTETSLRHILLHELFHYRHRDPLIHLLLNLLTILYWFHPCIWIILKDIRQDSEIACDASVLEYLNEDDRHAYGLTLLSFAQRKTVASYPFLSELGGAKHQLRKRIFLIASYQEMTRSNKRKSFIFFLIISVILSGFIPFLSSDASETDSSKESFSNTSSLDLETYFYDYDGCFLLYDTESEIMTVYNEDQADTRVSPDSTYKIYDALFALDQGIISPEESCLSWSGEQYPFPEWNQDQTLRSAMAASVNWYFQSLDAEMGVDTIRSYLQRIHYGNQAVSRNLDSYWMESSLKISPSEQLSLLRSFYENEWGFNPEYIESVKDTLWLSSSSDSVLYGKTGTGQVNGVNRNGWFVGFVESSGHTFFFVTNLQGSGASGSVAASITLSILSDQGVYVS